MLFIFVYFVCGGFCTKISRVRMRCDRFIRINSQWLFENFMRMKGQRSPTYENLVRAKYSGFTVVRVFWHATWRPAQMVNCRAQIYASPKGDLCPTIWFFLIAQTSSVTSFLLYPIVLGSFFYYYFHVDSTDTFQKNQLLLLSNSFLFLSDKCEPVPESAIFGYRRVPRHVPEYPWHRMRALAFASATSFFRGEKVSRARRSCSDWSSSGWLWFVVKLWVWKVEVLVNFSYRDVWIVAWKLAWPKVSL